MSEPRGPRAPSQGAEQMEAKNDIIVTSTDNNAGAVVWWSLSGEVEVGRVKSALVVAALSAGEGGELFATPTDAVAA